MIPSKPFRTGLIGLLAALSWLSAPAARAAAPANDDWANRQMIGAIPFVTTEAAVQEATLEPGDLSPDCSYNGAFHTVWYGYVSGPTGEYLSLKTDGSSYDTVLEMFTGVPGSFVRVQEACNDQGSGDIARILGVRLEPNTTYSIRVSSWHALSAPATLQLALARPPLYSVTKTEDTLDGSCDADCSLREAVSAHNANPGVVLVPAGSYHLTRTGAGENANATGDLDVLHGGAIYGAGAGVTVVDGDSHDRVMDVESTEEEESLVLADLTLTHGASTDNGGGAYVTNVRAVFHRVDVTDSSATLYGGGIRLFYSPTSRLRDCQLLRNQATYGGGLAVDHWYPNVERTTIAQNSATQNGGGIYNYRTFLTLIGSTISDNTAAQNGGGLYVSLGGGRLTLSGVSVVGNVASSIGGGLAIASGPVRMSNSLFSLNTSLNGMVDCEQVPGGTHTIEGGYNSFTNATSCDFAAGWGQGNLNGLDSRVSPVLALNGGRTLTHALLPGSPAIDSGSPGCADLVAPPATFGPPRETDQRGRPRPIDGNGDGVAGCDRGAYERTRSKGDLNGDRQTDLVLRSTVTGANAAWLMNGTSRSQELPVTPDPPDAQWSVVGVDDFTGDDVDDLVMRHANTGEVQVWAMGGPTGTARQGDPLPLTNAPTVGAPWTLAATGDFNRDGRSDLVWRNEVTQKLRIWPMAGTERMGVIVPVPDQAVDGNWGVVAALDLNGDAATDLLWYNSTSGNIVEWLMDDAVQRITGRFTSPTNAGNNNWKVVAGGDYGIGPGGQPGTPDVVWRNRDSGRLVVWHLDSTGVRTAGLFTTPDAPEPPLGWQVVGPR